MTTATSKDATQSRPVKEIASDAVNNFLSEQCVTFQKRRAFFIGPAMLLLAIWGWWVTRTWQVAVIVGVMVTTNILFSIGLRVARKGGVEKSLWLAVIPTLVTCMSVGLLIDGFDVALVLTAISLVVQVSVFSKRIALGGIVGICILVLSGQAFDNGFVLERLQISPKIALIASTIVALIMVGQFWVYLRRHHDNGQLFLSQQHTFTTRREKMLKSVAATIPFVEKSVGETSGISDDLASSALSQAGLIEAITDKLSALLSGASDNTKSAQQSFQISKGMQNVMRDNFERLQDMSKTSEDVASNIQNTRKIITALVSQTNNVEKILSYNRSIGEQIKVLSVNASIEAAEAGEYGAGFAVVAREMTEMIDSTEKNLFETAEVLNEIRRQSSLGMASIDTTTSILDGLFAELARTRDTLERAVTSANAAASQTQQIVQGVQRQQDDLAQVGEGTQSLLDNAFELAVSSALLQDTVAQMDEMRVALADTVKGAVDQSLHNAAASESDARESSATVSV